MNVRELIEALQERVENGDVDEDAEVLLAHQPHWPLAETLAGVVASAELGDEESEEEGLDATERVLWLAAGGHPYDRSPYAPRAVFQVEAW